jgi:hypothetical protein
VSPALEARIFARGVPRGSSTAGSMLATFLLLVAARLAGAGGMPYALFDRLPPTHLQIGGGRVDVAFAPGDSSPSKERLLVWISDAARAVSAYYGRLPVERVRVLVTPAPGRGIRNGTTFGYRGAAINVTVGRDTQASDLTDDWVMTHEMVHLALPGMGDEHDWLDEGIATYVEPLARSQSGQVPPRKVWADLVWGLPKGLPRPGDRGLDHTPTWGRTYWGGALFCLLADLEIRQRTANRKGLQDSLRAVIEAGGNVETRWPIERILDTGDRAIGAPVLHELYDRMKAAPVAVDLGDLWRRLGVRGGGERLTLDDSAPLAAVRRAIVAGGPVAAKSAPVPEVHRWAARPANRSK